MWRVKSLEGSGQLEREPGREKGNTKGQNRADRQGLGVVFHHQQQQSFVYFWGRPRDQRWEVQFSRSVMTDSLWPHESQHTRPPCPSPTPRVHSNSCALSQWCHPAISSSVVPFASCPQSLPASWSFPMTNQLFAWGGQSIGVSASASDLSMNTQDWSP